MVLSEYAVSLQRFEAYLKQHEGRYTIQKKAIAERVFKAKAPFEIEVFIDTIRKRDRHFSRATVYRTIKQLIDADLLQKIPTMDGKVFYEAKSEAQQHAHLICKLCGSIEEIDQSSFQNFLETYCKTVGFSIEYQSLHLYGSCRNCSRKMSDV